MKFLIIEIIFFNIIIISTINDVLIESTHHFANWSIIRRNRRGLIFNGGGTAKVLSLSIIIIIII